MALTFAALLYCTSMSVSAERNVVVDIANRTIDGVDMKLGMGEITSIVGQSRVVKEIEYLEGDPSDLYVIDFYGHKVYRHWNGISFTDSFFQTKKGLRVGSTISEFDREYGVGELSWSEGAGHVVRYSAKETTFVILTPGGCITYQNKEVTIKRRYCKATEIWFVNRSM
ncbi:MAG: hypothetical protein V3W31_08355 [Thermodesulfobacteriota bacterium]